MLWPSNDWILCPTKGKLSSGPKSRHFQSCVTVTGRGLDYLHTGVGTRHGIIHRDVKSSNILLDENWEARISDFGLSKIGPTNQSSSYIVASVKGTFGYLDPEYFYTRILTRKTDVFAFGVVLFELLSGRLPVDMRHGEEQCSLVRWAQKCVKERKVDQMVDSNIIGKIFPKCLRKFTQIAYDCLHSDPKERPTMAEVVVSLQGLLELQHKYDNSANSLGSNMGFTWRIHKYFTLMTKENSDQSTSSSTNIDDGDQGKMPHQDGGDQGEMPHQHGESGARDLKISSYGELECASRDNKDRGKSTIRDAVEDSITWPVPKVIPILRGDYSDLELKPVGTLEVKLVQAQGLRNKGIIGKSDPFAELYIHPLLNKMKTSKVINNDLNPIWNEHFEFVVEDISTHLMVKIYDDERLRAAILLGCAQVQLSQLEPGKVKDVWIKLVKDLDLQRDDKDRGKVHLELLYCPYGMENGFTSPFTSNFRMTSLGKVLKSGDTENGELVNIKRPVNIVNIRGVLSVTVISAEDLQPVYLMGKADPFVVLAMKKTGMKNSTRVVNDSLNPVWNQTFDFVVEDGLHDMLIVEVYDHDTFGKDYMGRCILTLTSVMLEGEYKDSFPLDGAKSGKLSLNLKWMAQPIYRDS